MKNNLITWGLGATLILTGSACTQQTQRPERDSELTLANCTVASVVSLRGDTTELILKDYLPTLGEVDSLTSPTLTLLPATEAGMWQVVNHAHGEAFHTIEVWRGKQTLTLIAQHTLTQEASTETTEEAALTAASATSPRLITLHSKEKDEVLLGYTLQPEKVIALWQNQALSPDAITLKKGTLHIDLPKRARKMERSYLRIYAESKTGIFNDILIPLHRGETLHTTAQITRQDPQAQVLYSLMIDRFNNGNPANDRPLNRPDVLPQVDYQGGDLSGITQKIRAGFFTDLGIRTIWLSPITQNPLDAWGENTRPATKFSAYHGYWPIYSTVLDSRFGTEAELRELLSEAHARGLNVILDYVANHLHIDSPVLSEHPDWVTPLILPDGRKNLSLWDEQRLTTWFDEHIPTLDLARTEVVEPMTDSALHWLTSFDFDGFRHDATKHIPHRYWRTLTEKMRTRLPERTFYQIGETYGSPELIGSYVRTGMLDAQFDFNLYDATTHALVNPQGSLIEVERTLRESMQTYGHHNVMGYISGNHDRPRFISLAGGALTFDEDSKAAGWNRTVGVGDSTAYRKLALLEALIFTIPGVPCLYQGDEYGIPGGNDPDNRRMMNFGDYSPREKQHLQQVKQLAQMRQQHLPLLFGQYLPLYVSKEVWIFARVYLGEVLLVAMNRSAQEQQVRIELSNLLGATESSGKPTAHFGQQMHTNNDLSHTITLSPLSFDLFTDVTFRKTEKR